MAGARLEVRVATEGTGEPVELALGANVGEAVQPLARAASGGELARAMLAIRLVGMGGPQTMVFDEVDAGVGGAAALALGEALHEVGGDRQVLVVTHLAQVASRPMRRSAWSSTRPVAAPRPPQSPYWERTVSPSCHACSRVTRTATPPATTPGSCSVPRRAGSPPRVPSPSIIVAECTDHATDARRAEGGVSKFIFVTGGVRARSGRVSPPPRSAGSSSAVASGSRCASSIPTSTSTRAP